MPRRTHKKSSSKKIAAASKTAEVAEEHLPITGRKTNLAAEVVFQHLQAPKMANRRGGRRPRRDESSDEEEEEESDYSSSESETDDEGHDQDDASSESEGEETDSEGEDSDEEEEDEEQLAAKEARWKQIDIDFVMNKSLAELEASGKDTFNLSLSDDAKTIFFDYQETCNAKYEEAKASLVELILKDTQVGAKQEEVKNRKPECIIRNASITRVKSTYPTALSIALNNFGDNAIVNNHFAANSGRRSAYVVNPDENNAHLNKKLIVPQTEEHNFVEEYPGWNLSNIDSRIETFKGNRMVWVGHPIIDLIDTNLREHGAHFNPKEAVFIPDETYTKKQAKAEKKMSKREIRRARFEYMYYKVPQPFIEEGLKLARRMLKDKVHQVKPHEMTLEVTRAYGADSNNTEVGELEAMESSSPKAGSRWTNPEELSSRAQPGTQTYNRLVEGKHSMYVTLSVEYRVV